MRWFPDWFNDLGFIVTLAGFVFTIIQIMIIKSRQKTISEAEGKTIAKINNYEHLLFLTKCEVAISEMKRLVIKDDYIKIDKEASEIKKALNACLQICISDGEKVAEAILKLGMNQSNINKILSNKENDFEKDEFLSNLDEIKDIFSIAIELCKYGDGRNSKG